MEATDLRINNLIWGPDKETICTVKYIDGEENSISTDKFSERHAVDFQPILLTDEWLLKFGFVKVLDYPCFRLDGLQIEFNGFDSQWGSGLLDEKTVTKYVHQLQNLFFALKGKELTLNKTIYDT